MLSIEFYQKYIENSIVEIYEIKNNTINFTGNFIMNEKEKELIREFWNLSLKVSKKWCFYLKIYLVKNVMKKN